MAIRVTILAGVWLLASACASPVTQTGESGGRLHEQADAIVDAFHAAGAFQGVVLLAADGEIVYQRAVGNAEMGFGVPNRPATRFQIASVSKPFTAAAVLLLAERGEVALDAPLTAILPDYPGGERLTLDHLLTHTSGIPNVNGFDGYDQWSKNNHTTAGLVALFADRPLQFEPGAKYSYSNSNYNLLAHIVEIVSGQTYGEFLDTNIFQPLGMTDTAHRGDPGLVVADLAQGYVARGARDFARAPYLDWTIKTGNGSLYSTAADLLKFDRALRAGELLEPESMAVAYGFERDLGYGWFPGERLGERKVHINGRSPGYTAHFERYVDTDRTLIILSNLYISPPPPLLNGLAALLLGRTPDLDGFDMASSDIALERFTGTYKFGDDWFVPDVTTAVENRDDHLVLRYLDGEAAGYEMILVPLGGERFFDRTHGGLFRYEAAQSGVLHTLIYEYGNEWRATRLD